MSYEWLTTKISDEEPCGPDLFQSDDTELWDYYGSALNRLPQSYVAQDRLNPDRELPFDPATIRIGDEEKRIEALLRSSRDLRLLVLLAQFECLAGRAQMLATIVTAIADAIAIFGDLLHPSLDTGLTDRKEALSELQSEAAMVQPLLHLVLASGSGVTVRKLQVASGQVAPRSYEKDWVGQNVAAALAEREHRSALSSTHASLGQFIDALQRIDRLCSEHSRHPFTIGFERPIRIAKEARDAIATSMPGLANAATPPNSGQGEALVSDGDLPKPSSHDDARQMLLACERYFQANERSSAALLLIIQARLLIGEPLVKAIETLLPNDAKRMVIDFGQPSGFQIAVDQLRSLSAALTQDSAEPSPEPVRHVVPEVTSRAEVALILRGVEAYFQARERSSPVPLLLNRARGFLEKDFEALVTELIPKSRG